MSLPAWVKVEERKPAAPKDDVEHLTLWDGVEIVYGRYVEAEAAFYAEHGALLIASVTHWLEMPKGEPTDPVAW